MKLTTITNHTTNEVMNVEFTFDSPSDYSIRCLMPGGIKADLTDPVRTCEINSIDDLIEEFIIWMERDGDDITIETDGGDSPSPEDANIASVVAAIMDWHESRYDGIEPESEWNG